MARTKLSRSPRLDGEEGARPRGPAPSTSGSLDTRMTRAPASASSGTTSSPLRPWSSLPSTTTVAPTPGTHRDRLDRRGGLGHQLETPLDHDPPQGPAGQLIAVTDQHRYRHGHSLTHPRPAVDAFSGPFGPRPWFVRPMAGPLRTGATRAGRRSGPPGTAAVGRCAGRDASIRGRLTTRSVGADEGDWWRDGIAGRGRAWPDPLSRRWRSTSDARQPGRPRDELVEPARLGGHRPSGGGAPGRAPGGRRRAAGRGRSPTA